MKEAKAARAPTVSPASTTLSRLDNNSRELVQRGEKGQLKPGSILNPRGRPKSARSKLSESFLVDLHDVFLERGKAAIEEVCKDKPAEFLRVIAQVLPKQLQAEDDDGNVYGVALITSNAIEAIIERGRK